MAYCRFPGGCDDLATISLLGVAGLVRGRFWRVRCQVEFRSDTKVVTEHRKMPTTARPLLFLALGKAQRTRRMVWLERIIRRLKNLHLTDVALEIATRKRDAAWQLVARRVGSMSTPEARGYIRARVASLVVDEVDRVMRLNEQLRLVQRPQLVRLATVALVDQTMVDVRGRSSISRDSQRAA